MNDELRTLFSRLCGFLLAGVAILFTLAATVYGISGDGELLAREMIRYAPPETTGLPAAEYPGAAHMIAAYLTGEEENFQYSFADAEGRVFLCFQSHEADHMADCRKLILLAGTLRRAAGAAVLVLAGAGILLRRRRKAFAVGMLAALCVTGIMITGLVVWAAVNFDGLFVTFHRIAFTNDGWLLNPRTDLLIRLMPLDFFTAMAARLVLWVLAAMAAVGAAAWIMIKTGGNVSGSQRKTVNCEL